MRYILFLLFEFLVTRFVTADRAKKILVAIGDELERIAEETENEYDDRAVAIIRATIDENRFAELVRDSLTRRE